jgi:hypothetical protein
MTVSGRMCISVILLAVVFASLALAALVGASHSMPGDGLRHVLLFLAGMFTVALFSALSKVLRIIGHGEEI